MQCALSTHSREEYALPVFVFVSLFYICICSVFVFVSLIVFIFVFALTAENEVRHPAVHWSAKVRAVLVVPPEVPHLNLK